jgi:exopolysaccharide biosynthesis protein
MPVTTKIDVKPVIEKLRLTLNDGQQTTVYIMRFEKIAVRPRLVRFESAIRLVEWCRQQHAPYAINGGFFVRSAQIPLGDLWLGGVRQTTATFDKRWSDIRGSLNIGEDYRLNLAPRNKLPRTPIKDLMQAGPLLVSQGISKVTPDMEGFSSGANQFDTDISVGRYPRAAIAMNDEYIWALVANGRHPDEAGLSFDELAQVCIDVGATEALNVDGGASSSLVYDYKLQNKPRSDYELFAQGAPIHSAIVFDIN